MGNKLVLISIVFLLSTAFTTKSDNAGTSAAIPSTMEEKRSLFNSHLSNLFETLKLNPNQADMEKPDFKLFRTSMIGYLNLKSKNKLPNTEVITIIDYRKPSNEKRLWVIDLSTNEILFFTYVAHGRNSGYVYAQQFSNVHESFKSSIGFYVTSNTYYGKHGLSMKLDGVDWGYNHNARNRTIVLHGAKYANESYVQKYNRLGRSLGCPAIPFEFRTEMIGAMANGTCFFIYGTEKDYDKKSRLLNEEKALDQFLLSRAF